MMVLLYKGIFKIFRITDLTDEILGLTGFQNKLETLEEYMETDNATGVENLAHSWDIVTWWAVYAFLHMDQTPVPNEL